MPYYPRKTYRRRRRYNRRSRRTMRKPMRSLSMKRKMSTHHFKRTFLSDIFFSSNTGPVFGGLSFRLSSLPNYTEFTNLFDQYRINKIVIRFVPSANSDSVGSTHVIPNFHTIIDNNDSTTPTALNELYESQSWKRTRGTQVQTRVFTPSSLIDIGLSSNSPKWKQWISTDFPSVDHYGLKYALEATVNAQDIYYQPYVTIYFSTRSVK